MFWSGVENLQGAGGICSCGIVGADDVLLRALGVGHDVTDPTSECPHRASWRARCSVADVAASGAIFFDL